MTWEAISPVRMISSSTPVGRLSSWPSSDRSWSLRASSAGWRTGVFEDVVDGFDQARAVTDQPVAAAAGQTVDGAGHGEDLAILLHGVMCGRERPAPRRGFDHHHPKT